MVGKIEFVSSQFLCLSGVNGILVRELRKPFSVALPLCALCASASLRFHFITAPVGSTLEGTMRVASPPAQITAPGIEEHYFASASKISKSAEMTITSHSQT